MRLTRRTAVWFLVIQDRMEKDLGKVFLKKTIGRRGLYMWAMMFKNFKCI